MNLALRDIRHNLIRFALTAVGIGLLLMIVMGMGGIYRGLIEEATLLVDRVGADIWVVQKGTRGPFAEISRVSMSLEDRLAAVPGVLNSHAFVSHTIQREYGGKPLRMVVQGLSWPQDTGEWLALVAGRPLGAAHFEMIADKMLGLRLGDRVSLGKDMYTVVGITADMSGISGDGMAFFTVQDALAIQFDTSAEATRLERSARRSRVEKQDIGNSIPSLVERAQSPSANLAAIARPAASAVLVQLLPGTDPAAVTAVISAWADVTPYTAEQQRHLLLSGMVDRSRRQLGLFRTLLVTISAVIMALILYTLTLDKIHDIAMLKLMGARNSVILGLILQQALILGAVGYGLAFFLGGLLFPLFPRRVVLTTESLAWLAGIVLVISLLSSLLGIWKAMRVDASEVLS
jgi:putative ABC transport system permease protein